MIYDLFAMSGFFAYLLITAAFLLLVITTNQEHYFWSTIVVILVILFFQFFSAAHPFNFVVHNPLTCLSAFIIYFVIGAVWCIVKWYFYCLNAADSYKDARDRYLESRNWSLATLTDTQKANLRTELKYKSAPPSARENKARIYGWIVYWPFSAIWTLLNDPIRRIGMVIYNQLSGVLQTISNKIFNRFEELS